MPPLIVGNFVFRSRLIILRLLHINCDESRVLVETTSNPMIFCKKNQLEQNSPQRDALDTRTSSLRHRVPDNPDLEGLTRAKPLQANTVSAKFEREKGQEVKGHGIGDPTDVGESANHSVRGHKTWVVGRSGYGGGGQGLIIWKPCFSENPNWQQHPPCLPSPESHLPPRLPE